jgi:hypothetical protein
MEENLALGREAHREGSDLIIVTRAFDKILISGLGHALEPF